MKNILLLISSLFLFAFTSSAQSITVNSEKEVVKFDVNDKSITPLHDTDFKYVYLTSDIDFKTEGFIYESDRYYYKNIRHYKKGKTDKAVKISSKLSLMFVTDDTISEAFQYFTGNVGKYSQLFVVTEKGYLGNITVNPGSVAIMILEEPNQTTDAKLYVYDPKLSESVMLLVDLNITINQ